MRNLRFTISYDGTSYSGFQTQPKGNTVQDKLEQAVLMLTGEKVKVISSGRTDAGVHARGQVINFTTSSVIPVTRWCLALNTRLPKDIIALNAEEVPLSFHSRKSAKRKTYCYTIRNSRFPNVFQRPYEFHHPTILDVESMRDSLPCLIGEHDFSSFCTVRTDKDVRVRTIYEAWMEVEYEDQVKGSKVASIRIFVRGNGFLYNMVRIIVGTMLQIGEGKRKSSEMQEILEARSRGAAGPTAEALGLMLWSVEY
ncbi:tRNA pseudouridine synthase A [compost metagenome]